MTTFEFKDERQVTLFILTITKLEDHYCDWTCEEVSAWDGDSNKPVDCQQYVRGSIKWDGCSHIWFGEKSECDGYLHLCGKLFWTRHCIVMQWIWDTITPLITSYDKSIAETL